MGYEFGNSKLINGVVWGVVTDNKHPDGKYMVKAKLPWIYDSSKGDKSDFTTSWMKVMTPMAGGGRGFYVLPEIGDEVVLAPVHGSIRQMVVIGCVWSDTDKSPHGGEMPQEKSDPMGNALGISDSATDTADGKNNARYFASRSGSILLFDDTKDKVKVIIKSAKGSAMVVNDEKELISIFDHASEVYLHLDKKNKKITLESKEGDIDIFCKKGTLNIEAKKIVSKASTDQDHKADGKWKQESGGTMDMKAGGTMTEKAPKIDLNP